MLSKSQVIQELLMSQVTLQVILLTKLGFVDYLKKIYPSSSPTNRLSGLIDRFSRDKTISLIIIWILLDIK